MKNVTLLLLITILTSCISNQKNNKIGSEINADNDLGKLNLKGNVKSIKQISYKAFDIFGELQKGEVNNVGNSCFYLTFNENGNEIEKIYYNSDGTVDDKWITKYDEEGNEIENNNFTSDGSLLFKLIHKFDNKGNRIESNTYNSDGSINSNSTHKYDEKENYIESISHISDGYSAKKETYSYDDKGNVIEKNGYEADGSIRFKFLFHYDDKGNKIEDSYITSDYTTNSTFKFDNKGNVIEELESINKSESIKNKYTYEYDEKDNWIKKVVYKNLTPTVMLERDIVYYELK